MLRIKQFMSIAIMVTLLFSAFVPLKSEKVETVKLNNTGTTYNLAQVLRWFNSDSFVVGRWDGSLSFFRRPSSSEEYGPVMMQALLPPSKKGIEMIAVINSSLLVTSDDSTSMAIWGKKNNEFSYEKNIDYANIYGTANSGEFIPYESGNGLLVTGHSQGYIIIWQIEDRNLICFKAVDVNSSNPIPSPYPLKNVRSVVKWKDNIVITGSEDGDLCMVKIPEGTILYRIRYNPNAKRGINYLYLYNDYLLLANCSVGKEDKNLWLYKVSQNTITPLDSYNLIKDTTREQVFNFCVVLTSTQNELLFVASTEEGLLWLGKVENDKIKVISNTAIDLSGTGGAALDIFQDTGELASTSYAIRLFSFEASNSK